MQRQEKDVRLSSEVDLTFGDQRKVFLAPRCEASGGLQAIFVNYAEHALNDESTVNKNKRRLADLPQQSLHCQGTSMCPPQVPAQTMPSGEKNFVDLDHMITRGIRCLPL